MFGSFKYNQSDIMIGGHKFPLTLCAIPFLFSQTISRGILVPVTNVFVSLGNQAKIS